MKKVNKILLASVKYQFKTHFKLNAFGIVTKQTCAWAPFRDGVRMGRIRNSPLSRVQQNITNNTRVGLQFEGTSNSSDLVLGNDMQDHYHGMELQLTGVLGTQIYSGNKWTGYNGTPLYEDVGGGNFVGAWAHEDFVMLPQELQQSRFTINGTINTEFYPYNNHVPSPFNNDWFVPGGGTNQTFSNPASCTNLLTYPDLNLRLLDSLIVNDSSLTTVYVDEIKKVSTLHLREKLELKKQTDDLGMFFSNFLNTYSTTPLGKISRYRDTLSILAPLGLDSMDFILLIDSSLHANLHALNILIDEGGEPDAVFIDEMKTLCNNLTDTWHRSFMMLSEEIDITVHDLIGVVTTAHIIESNLKQAYSAFLDYLTGIDTIEVYLEQLESIAGQCVFEGGPGVIIARNILAGFEVDNNYDDNQLCNSERFTLSQSIPLSQKSNKLIVFPNPSSGKYSLLIISAFENEEFNLEVSDLSGKVVFQNTFNSGSIHFDLSHIKPGTYILNVQGNIHYGKRKLIRMQ